jgi:hypothetical protein
MDTNDRSAATGAHGGEPPKPPKGVRASAGGKSSALPGVNAKGGAPAFAPLGNREPWASASAPPRSSRTPLSHTLKLAQ